jgi:hypothetical protein
MKMKAYRRRSGIKIARRNASRGCARALLHTLPFSSNGSRSAPYVHLASITTRTHIMVRRAAAPLRCAALAPATPTRSDIFRRSASRRKQRACRR